MNNPERYEWMLSAWVLGMQALHINPEIRLKMRLCNAIPETHANTFKALTFIIGIHAALPALGILLLGFLCKDEL